MFVLHSASHKATPKTEVRVMPITSPITGIDIFVKIS